MNNTTNRILKSTVAVSLCWLTATSALAQPQTASLAPDFEFTVNGQTYQLSDLRGKVVVLDFWASWCGPCQRSLPELNRLSNENSDVMFLGVNDENNPTIQRVKRTLDLKFPTILDSDDSISDRYGVRVVPTTVVIDGNGRVTAVIEGFHADDTVARAIERARRGV